MISVSVVVPAYNAGSFIREALSSALRQTRPPLEVIVVDDGSTDETASVVRSFGDRVSYLYQANARQAAARNLACRSARGDAFAFLDADDVWREDKLARQVELLEAHPSVGLVYCSMREFGDLTRLRQATVRGRCFREILLGEEGGGISGSTPVVRRPVYEELGGFREDLTPCEDTDFFWRAAAIADIAFVEDVLVQYRVHDGNAHRNVDRTTRAWELLYARAFDHPAVQGLGPVFRARAKGRLYSMLSGEHAAVGRYAAALRYGFMALLGWPFVAPRLLRGSLRVWRRGGGVAI